MLQAATFKPMNKWVLVKADERVKKTKGGIELPDQMVAVERVMEGTGHVLKVGKDVMKTLGMGLEPGMKVAYRGFLKDTTSPYFEPIDGCPVFLIMADDILAIVDEDTQLGAFS